MKDFIIIFLAITRLLLLSIGAVFGSIYCLSIGRPILAFIIFSLCVSSIVYLVYMEL
jgi:hypothetical protein